VDVQPELQPIAQRTAQLRTAHETLMTASRTPARASASRCQAISGLPRTSSRVFGMSSVSGRNRSPRPAARTIAFTALTATFWGARIRGGEPRHEVALNPRTEFGEFAVARRGVAQHTRA